MLVAASIACASGELPPRAANDPSSPSAPEMPPAPLAAAPLAAESGGAHDHAHHASAMGGDAGASFTCPMHPDVVQPGPGRCPKCGMELVKKAGP